MRLGIWLFTLVFLVSSCAHYKNANYKHSNPIVLNFDIAPGYTNNISQSISEDSDLRMSVLVLKPKPIAKWNSNVYFALLPKETSQAYIFHIVVDTDKNMVYAHMKLMDDKGNFISNRTTPLLYKLRGKKDVRLTLKGKQLIVYLNNTVVDEVKLPFQASTLEIGASSGAFKIRFIEPPPAAYPE